MKIVLTESQIKRILIEQDGETSDQTCSKSISSSPNTLNKWNSLKDKTALAGVIKSDIKNIIGKCVSEYVTWFSNPKTLAKFKTERERSVVKKIPSFLQGIKNINLSLGGPKGRNTVIAWVHNKNPTTINYNLTMIHNTERYIMSVYEITKHEIGHLIDHFFIRNGVKTYIQTIRTNTQQEYQDNYIVNDGDQYARLNYLRQLVGAGPVDSPKVLLTKFINKVKSGTITSPTFNMTAIQSKTANKSKNNTKSANFFNSKIGAGIVVNGNPSINLGQLFATFASGNGDDIMVSFDLIAKLNYTSKDTQRMYYYLKLSPK